MEQQRALNALEPFIALSKSATSPRAAADLIVQATSAQNTYVFAELLETPNIQALRDSADYSPHLRLLEIFAWGTYADYTNTPNLPPLNAAQEAKLHLLSLLPLCTAPPSTLTYPALRAALSLDSDLALESLVTTALHSSLIAGHLDPLARRVRVTSVAPLRDIAPGAVPSLLAHLDAWDARCGAVLADVDARVAAIRAASREQRARRATRDAVFEERLAAQEARMAERGEKKRSAPGGERNGREGLEELEPDEMDVDDGSFAVPSRGHAGRGLKQRIKGGVFR